MIENSRLRRILVNGATSLFALAVCVAAIEAGLRLAYPHSDRYYALAPNQTITLTPDEEHLPGVSGPARYRTSSWGIRGPEFDDADGYRILAIGGSTTQNGYLDQDETWTILLGTRLNEVGGAPKTWTGDIGRSGHTLPSHYLHLRNVVPQLPDIDAVVMLVGVNDLTVALRGGYEYDPPPPLSDSTSLREEIRLAFLQVPGRIHERATQYQSAGVPWWKRLAIYQLAREARESAVQARGGTQQDRFGQAYGVWRRHRAEASEVLDSLPDLDEPLRVYGENLTMIAREARRLGVRLVLVTQPTLWRPDLSDEEEARLWLGGTGDFQSESGRPYFSTRALRQAMDAYNATLMDVCRNEATECYDLAAELPSNTDVFYDDVHFTEYGATLVAGKLADYFAGLPPYAP